MNDIMMDELDCVASPPAVALLLYTKGNPLSSRSKKKSRTAKSSDKTKKKPKAESGDGLIQQETNESEEGDTESGESMKNDGNEDEEAVLQYPASSGEARSRLLQWLRPTAEVTGDAVTSSRVKNQTTHCSPCSSPRTETSGRSSRAHAESNVEKKDKKDKKCSIHANTIRTQRPLTMRFGIIKPEKELPTLREALLEVYRVYDTGVSPRKKSVAELWAQDKGKKTSRSMTKQKAKKVIKQRSKYVRSHAFALGRPPTSDGMGLIDDNDEDDLPVPSVLAYVYRFPADDEDTDQHKAETNNESTQNSGCTVPDNAAPAQEFDPEKRESQPKHLTLVAEMRSGTENKGSSGNVSDNGSSDTKDEVVSEWVQIGGDGRKQLLLTPNGGVLRIIDSTLGGEVCVVRPHFSLEYTLMDHRFVAVLVEGENGAHCLGLRTARRRDSLSLLRHLRAMCQRAEGVRRRREMERRDARYNGPPLTCLCLHSTRSDSALAICVENWSGQVSIFEPPLLRLLKQLEACESEDERYDLLSCFYRTLNDGVSHRLQSLAGESFRIEGWDAHHLSDRVSIVSLLATIGSYHLMTLYYASLLCLRVVLIGGDAEKVTNAACTVAALCSPLPLSLMHALFPCLPCLTFEPRLTSIPFYIAGVVSSEIPDEQMWDVLCDLDNNTCTVAEKFQDAVSPFPVLDLSICTELRRMAGNWKSVPSSKKRSASVVSDNGLLFAASGMSSLHPCAANIQEGMLRRVLMHHTLRLARLVQTNTLHLLRDERDAWEYTDRGRARHSALLSSPRVTHFLRRNESAASDLSTADDLTVDGESGSGTPRSRMSDTDALSCERAVIGKERTVLQLLCIPPLRPSIAPHTSSVAISSLSPRGSTSVASSPPATAGDGRRKKPTSRESEAISTVISAAAVFNAKTPGKSSRLVDLLDTHDALNGACCLLLHPNPQTRLDAKLMILESLQLSTRINPYYTFTCARLLAPEAMED